MDLDVGQQLNVGGRLNALSNKGFMGRAAAIRKRLVRPSVHSNLSAIIATQARHP